MQTFTDFAEDKTYGLYNSHENEVGSQLKLSEPVKYKDYQPTDCITHSIKVINYAFEKWVAPRRQRKFAVWVTRVQNWRLTL